VAVVVHDSELDDEDDNEVVVDGSVGSGEAGYVGSPLGPMVIGGNGVGNPAGGLCTSQQVAWNRWRRTTYPPPG